MIFLTVALLLSASGGFPSAQGFPGPPQPGARPCLGLSSLPARNRGGLGYAFFSATAAKGMNVPWGNRSLLGAIASSFRLPDGLPSRSLLAVGPGAGVREGGGGCFSSRSRASVWRSILAKITAAQYLGLQKVWERTDPGTGAQQS